MPITASAAAGAGKQTTMKRDSDGGTAPSVRQNVLPATVIDWHEAVTKGAAVRIPPLWLTLISFLCLHLVLAALIPPVEDEAYYALWASVPSLGYYDHPGMIAWWIWIGEHLLGHTPLGLRLVSVLAYATVPLMAARMALRLGGEAPVAAAAALLANATVLIFVLGFTATPDAPSVFFWTLTSWAMVEAVTTPDRRISARWWLLAGLAAGLGVQSKFTNFFLWVGIVLWLLATAEGRVQLRRPVVWLAAALAVAALAPLLWWNAAHHWIGLTRQFGRVDQVGFTPLWTLQYILGAVVLVTPLIAWAALRTAIRDKGPARMLVWLALPMLAYMLYHSTHAKVQGNWLVPLFPGVAVLAALGARGLRPRFVTSAAAVGTALGALTLLVAFWPGTPLISGHNPPNETRGWHRMVAELRADMSKSGARWIATDEYGLTGSLFYAMPDTIVWSMIEPQRYLFRGPLPARLCNAPGLLVSRNDPDARVIARFRSHGQTVQMNRTAGGRSLDTYSVTPVAGLLPDGSGTCPPEPAQPLRP